MSVFTTDRIVVCGRDGNCLDRLRQVLGPDGDGLTVMQDPREALKAARDRTAFLFYCPDESRTGLDRSFREALEAGGGGVPVVVGLQNGMDRGEAVPNVIYVPVDQFESQLGPVLALATAQAGMHARLEKTEADRELCEQVLNELIRIGKLFGGRKDVDDLLEIVLSENQRVTGADAGCVYLVEEVRRAGTMTRQLQFKVSTREGPFADAPRTLELSESSIPGYVALTREVLRLADVHDLPAEAPYHFDVEADCASGYRTRSMVVFPLLNHKDEVIGVIQLVNKKKVRNKTRDYRLDFSDPTSLDQVESFEDRDVEIGDGVATQAAVALEKGQLLENMLKLFDGFVASSAAAVEVMDSATSGHCERLAKYAVNTALEINKVKDGPLGGYQFDKHKLRELRYAALLHDIGKLGVRESILKKDRRLTEDRLESIIMRFRYFKEVLRHKTFRQTMNQMLMKGLGNVNLVDVERKLQEEIAGIDEVLNFIVEINSYGKLDDADYEKLKKIYEMKLEDSEGNNHDYLTADELDNLSVRRGNLTPSERQEIEEHAVHTYNILASMPWLPEYKYVPEIAGGHHERMDGSGYPNRLPGDQIPIGAQILAMLDIYEALTASDRPYKPSVPVDRALKILQLEADANHLNKAIVDLFIEKRIYETVDIPKPKAGRKEGSTKEAW